MKTPSPASAITLPDDVLLHVCEFADIQTAMMLSYTSRNMYRLLASLRVIEELFVRQRGFNSIAEFRKTFNVESGRNIREILRNICKQIKSPDVRTEDDKLFVSMLYRLAEKCDSTMKGVALMRSGHWNNSPSTYIKISKSDEKWFEFAEKAHPENILNAVENRREWDEMFL